MLIMLIFVLIKTEIPESIIELISISESKNWMIQQHQFLDFYCCFEKFLNLNDQLLPLQVHYLIWHQIQKIMFVYNKFIEIEL